MGLHENLAGIKTLSDGLIANKVSRFAYTAQAYSQNMVAGHDVYNPDNENNIPSDTPSVMKVNTTVVDRGYRARASSLTRMFLNHLYGRTSYNLNKLNDLFNSLLSYLDGALGTASGIATLDANGRIPYSQLPESAVELKGYWNASTNSPALADGTGDTGDEYYVSVAGTQNLGSGSQYFNVGDRVLYLDGVWRNINATAVKKVCNVAPNAEGNVSLGKSDVGLGNVQNVTTSATPVSGGTDNFSTGGAYSLGESKVDKTTLNGGAVSACYSSNLATGKALVSDANGKVAVSGVTSTELGYLSGVTSGVQSQLNGKVADTTKVNGHALSSDVTVTKSDVGLGNVANVGSTASVTEDSADNFTSGGAYALKQDILGQIPSLSFKKLQSTVVTPIANTTVDGWGVLDGSFMDTIVANAGILTYLQRDTSQASCPQHKFWVVICSLLDARYDKIRWAYANDSNLLNMIATGGGNTLQNSLWSGTGAYSIVGDEADVTRPIVVWFDAEINAKLDTTVQGA